MFKKIFLKMFLLFSIKKNLLRMLMRWLLY